MWRLSLTVTKCYFKHICANHTVHKVFAIVKPSKLTLIVMIGKLPISNVLLTAKVI